MLTELFGTALAVAPSIMNMVSNNKTNKINKEIADDANAQAKELSNTSHQREVADLKLAGLNPRLSAGGQGASTPGMQTSTAKPNNFDGVAPAISSALSAKLARDQFDQQKIMQNQQIRQGEEDIALTKLKQDTEINSANNIQEDTFNKVQSNKLLENTYGNAHDERNAKLRHDLYNAYAADSAADLQQEMLRRKLERTQMDTEYQNQGFEHQKSRFKNENGKWLVPLNEATSQIGNILSVGTGAKSLMYNAAKQKIKRESYNGAGEHTGTTYTSRGN